MKWPDYLRAKLRFSFQYAASFPRFVFYYLRLWFTEQHRGNDRPERIVAIVLSWKRTRNLPQVVFGLKKQSYIDDIVILHNHPSRLPIPGCTNTFLEGNQGTIIRHEIASKLSGYDFFVFSDDDLMLSDDFASEVIPAMRALGKESVLGFFGRNVEPSHSGAAYTSGKYIRAAVSPVPVDIVLGRFHIISKRGIDEIARSGLNTPALRSEDDIRANVILQRRFGKPSFVLPRKHRIIELLDSNALSHRKDHFERRNNALRDALELGWNKVDIGSWL